MIKPYQSVEAMTLNTDEYQINKIDRFIGTNIFRVNRTSATLSKKKSYESVYQAHWL